MKNKILFLLAVICFSFVANVSAAEKNKKPFVIPELREWKGATGEFQITSETRIFYSKKSAELAEVAKQFACDFKKMTGSNKDLWWFVNQKMAYNELLPKLKGKKH